MTYVHSFVLHSQKKAPALQKHAQSTSMVKLCTSNSLSVAANLRDTFVPTCTGLGETVGGTVMMIKSPGLAGENKGGRRWMGCQSRASGKQCTCF